MIYIQINMDELLVLTSRIIDIAGLWVVVSEDKDIVAKRVGIFAGLLAGAIIVTTFRLYNLNATIGIGIPNIIPDLAQIIMFIGVFITIVIESNNPGYMGFSRKTYLNTFFKYLKFTGHSEAITLYQRADDVSVLGITMENSTNGTKIDGEIKLISLETPLFDVPSMEIDITIDMDTTEFQRICKNLSSISDRVIIESKDNQDRFIAEGDTGTLVMNVSRSNNTGDSDGKHARGIFKLKHLQAIAKSSNLCNNVSINLSNDVPLVLKYNVANLGSIKFLLCSLAED
jgi:proliferating cell nuclear antigen